MPFFTYQARDASGATRAGEIEAGHVREAVQALIGQQLTVLHIKEKGGPGDRVSPLPIALAGVVALALLAWHFLH